MTHTSIVRRLRRCSPLVESGRRRSRRLYVSVDVSEWPLAVAPQVRICISGRTSPQLAGAKELQPADGKVTTATMPWKRDFREFRTGCTPILRVLASLAANDATVGVSKYGSSYFACQEKDRPLRTSQVMRKRLGSLRKHASWLQ